MSEMSAESQLIKQILDNQKAIFHKIELMQTSLSVLARVEEKQISDRASITRIGNEMRECRAGCHGEIKSNAEKITGIDRRVSKLENTSGTRGQLLDWLRSILTAVFIAYVVWRIKG